MRELAAIQCAGLGTLAQPSGTDLLAVLQSVRARPVFERDQAADGLAEGAELSPSRVAARHRLAYWPSAATAPTLMGFANSTAVGTATARAPAATGLVAGSSRTGYVAGLTAGSWAGWRDANAQFLRSTAFNDGGGFFFCARVNFATIRSTTGFFVGLAGQTTQLTATLPLNAVGWRADTSSGQIYACTSGGAGQGQSTGAVALASKTTVTSVVDFAAFSPRGVDAVQFGYRILPDGAWNVLSITPLVAGNAPANNVFLAPHAMLLESAVQTTGSAIDLHQFYVGTDY